MTKSEFRYSIYIATTPEKLWKALTDGAVTEAYWGRKRIRSDWKPGSTVTFQSDYYDPVRGTVVEADPPWRLVMDWRFEVEAGADLTPPSRITYRIERAGPRNVRLTVSQSAMAGTEEVDPAMANGWIAIMSNLKTYLETGRTMDFADRWTEAQLA